MQGGVCTSAHSSPQNPEGGSPKSKLERDTTPKKPIPTCKEPQHYSLFKHVFVYYAQKASLKMIVKYTLVGVLLGFPLNQPQHWLWQPLLQTRTKTPYSPKTVQPIDIDRPIPTPTLQEVEARAIDAWDIGMQTTSGSGSADSAFTSVEILEDASTAPRTSASWECWVFAFLRRRNWALFSPAEGKPQEYQSSKCPLPPTQFTHTHTQHPHGHMFVSGPFSGWLQWTTAMFWGLPF